MRDQEKSKVVEKATDIRVAPEQELRANDLTTVAVIGYASSKFS